MFDSPDRRAACMVAVTIAEGMVYVDVAESKEAGSAATTVIEMFQVCVSAIRPTVRETVRSNLSYRKPSIGFSKNVACDAAQVGQEHVCQGRSYLFSVQEIAKQSIVSYYCRTQYHVETQHNDHGGTTGVCQ